MIDIVLIVLMVAFFGISVGFVRGCHRLMEG